MEMRLGMMMMRFLLLRRRREVDFDANSVRLAWIFILYCP